MGFFDFLKDANTEKKVAGKAFSFLSNAVPGVQQTNVARKKNQEIQQAIAKLPKPDQTRIKPQLDKLTTSIPSSPVDFGVSMARGLARVPETVVRSSLQAGADLGHVINPAADLNFNQPGQNTGVKELLYGKEPLQTYQGRTAGNKKVIEGSRFRTAATPLSFLAAAGTIGGDIVPLGKPGKAVASTVEEGIQKLAKAGTEHEVRQIMKGTPQQVIDRVAPAIVQTKDPNIVRNLLDKAYTANVPGERQRGFLKSAQQAKNLSPEVRQGVADITPQTYVPKANNDLAAQTKKIVDENPEEALLRVYDGADNPAAYDENVMLGGHLIQKLQSEGKVEQAVKVAEKLDIQGRDLGRGVQSYAAITRLNPEGILVYAQKQIRKAREGHKDFTLEKPTVQNIKKQVEGFASEDAGAIKGAVQKTVKELSGESSTGEKLAKKVSKAASPVTKQKADTLVNELTKRVKQEYLAPKAKAQTSPLKILQDVFGRNKEAQEAYPEAQRILREKYVDNEPMQEALDKFFGSNLGPIPAASTTIDRAIAEQLKAKQVQVSKAIYNSWASQKQTVEHVTQALTKEGFDEKSAQILAKEVTGRLNKQFGEAKARTLERLAQEAPEKAHPTYIDKINKLSNIGALDKSDYIDLARAKLNLPNLKPETAQKLSELAQKVQTLPEGADKYTTVRQIKQLIEENTPLTGKQKAAQAVGTPRALLASGDISFGGRQAIAYATAHPIRFVQQWGKQFRFFKEGFAKDESRAFDEMMGEIQSHPDYELLKKSDLAITDPFGISPNAREEQFIGSHFAEKVPAIGRLVRGSNYAFTGLANSLRANEFYAQVAHAREAGIPLNDKLLGDLAKVINNGTGRGTVKALEGHMQSLSTALFAPRLILSRLQTLNPQYYLTLEPAARKEALRQLMGLSAFAVGAITIAKQAGLDVGTNPKSSDFGKIKVGNTRLDFLGGYTQYIRLGAQLATGETISSLSGRASQLGSGYGKKSRKDIVAKFLENKENPVVSFGTTLLAGQDAVGNPVNTPGDVGKQILSRFVPLVFQDVADMKTHDDSLNPLIGAPLAAVGVGTQTYGKQDIKLSDKQQKYVDKLKSNGASKEEIAANTDFFQTLKTTPSKTDTGEEVKKALKAKDINKATQLAKDYNKQYAETFNEWRQKYGKHKNDVLSKQYNKNLITENTFDTWAKNAQESN